MLDSRRNIEFEGSLVTFAEQIPFDPIRYCPKCEQHKEASKKLDLWQLPQILIIHLKRFSYDKGIWRDKIDEYIDFPLKGLDLTRFSLGPQDVPPIYDLFAVTVCFRFEFSDFFRIIWEDLEEVTTLQIVRTRPQISGTISTTLLCLRLPRML